jgi:hypothetical protein
MLSHGLTPEFRMLGPDHAWRWMLSVIVCGLALNVVVPRFTGQGALLWARPSPWSSLR